MPVQNITSKFEIDAADLDKLNAKFDGAIKKNQELDAAAKRAGDALKSSANSPNEPLKQQLGILERLEKEYRDLEAARRKSTNKAEIQGFNTELAFTKKRIDDLTKSQLNYNKEVKNTGQQGSMLGGSFKSIGGILAGVFAIDRVLDFGREIVNLGVKFESLKTAIEFSSGSAEAGALNMQYLSDVSKRLGLDLLGATQGFQQILASGRAAGLEGDTIRDVFEGVATAARVMGKSAADQEGIFLALSQILSKGTVSAEELRGQIGERLPGAFELAAKSIGVTTQELNKMLEQGQILSSEFVPKFAATLKAEFENGIPKAVQSTGYALTQLGNNYDKLLKNLSESNEGFINRTIKNTSKLLDFLGEAFKDQDKKVLEERLAANGAFENDITKQFKNIAKAAKESGKDVPQALGEAAKYYTDHITAQINKTQQEYDKLKKTGFSALSAEQDALGIYFKADYDKVLKQRKNTLEELRGELFAVNKAVEESLKVANPAAGKPVSPLGTIEQLENSIKALQARKKATSELSQTEANQFNNAIKYYQDLLDKLNGVEKAKAKGKANKGSGLESLPLPTFSELVDPLEGEMDVYFKAIDTLEKRLIDTPEKALEHYNKVFGIEMPAVLQKFTEAEIEEHKKRTAYFIEQEQMKLEEKEMMEQAAFDFAANAASAYLDFRSQQLSDELGMIQALKEGELILAGENAAARAQIEQDYALKEAEIRKKQAINDRNQALFNVAISTAMGIMSVLSTGGGTRYADGGITAAVLSALVAATGAIQAGLILARPIPQFFKGTESSPEGFAWVGERGREGKLTPDGKFSVIPGGAHVDYLERGTKIIPNHQLDDFINKEIVTPNMAVSDSYNSGNNIDVAELGMQIGRNITLQQQVFNERGYREFTVRNNQRIERLNKKNRLNR
jgi:tape measure domain-containing protein